MLLPYYHLFIFMTFLVFLFTLFDVLKNILHILASPSLHCCFLRFFAEFFCIFLLCSAPLFYPWVGSTALWTPVPLASTFLLGYLLHCNTEEHVKKATILGNMLNLCTPKRYLKKITLTLTGSEHHASTANIEATINREKWGKNIVNMAINTQIG